MGEHDFVRAAMEEALRPRGQGITAAQLLRSPRAAIGQRIAGYTAQRRPQGDAEALENLDARLEELHWVLNLLSGL